MGCLLSYAKRTINIEERDKLWHELVSVWSYEEKADIYGCCVKLLTDSSAFKEQWQDNFYAMSSSIRSHGRIVAVETPSKILDVAYDPLSKTLFAMNFDYYGWVKSLALSLAGDILEDEHGIYSVHGACLDFDGKGVCLVGGSGVGKTTHTYGLLQLPNSRVIGDDWFFVRVYGDSLLCYGSEKNFYVRTDIASTWPELQKLLKRTTLDSRNRALVNLRLLLGKSRIVPLTTLKAMVVLVRDKGRGGVEEVRDGTTAIDDIVKSHFLNPHLLVEDSRKTALRRAFFEAIVRNCAAYVVNTTGSISETQRNLRHIVSRVTGV